MNWTYLFPRSLLAVATLAASGCGTNELDVRHPVTGTVTLDGEPLATGTITFFPVPEGPVASGGPIQNGEYSLAKEQGLPAGTYKVSIASTVTKGPVPTDPNELMENPPETISLVPKKYNSETILKAEISDSEENFIPFELSSK